MSATTVPTVRAALVTRLRAMLAVAPVDAVTTVHYGHPGQDVPAAFIAVADTADGVTREQRTLPLRKTSSRTETYDVRVIVWCSTGEHDSPAQQRVTEQAWALCTRIDDDLRGEPTLGGLVTWALPASFADEDYLLNEGRAAQIVVTITVHVTRA